MQVIILKKIGRFSPGIHEVKPGFGRYLINTNIALSCTPKNIDVFNSKTEEYKKAQVELDNSIDNLCKKINNKSISIISPVNETGNLYGSIKPKQLVEEIKKQLLNDPLITNKEIVAGNITKPGIFPIILRFNREQQAKIMVVIGNNDNVVKEMYLNYINEEKQEKKSTESVTNIKDSTLSIHKDVEEEKIVQAIPLEKDGE